MNNLAVRLLRSLALGVLVGLWIAFWWYAGDMFWQVSGGPRNYIDVFWAAVVGAGMVFYIRGPRFALGD